MMGCVCISRARAQDQRSSYTSDVFAFLGTLVLFIMFPSFNGAFAAEGAQFRVVINTALACCASGVTVTFPPFTPSTPPLQSIIG